jgi:hypothetical protein
MSNLAVYKPEPHKAAGEFVNLRGSAMPLGFRCPASVRRGGILINSSNEAADNGTAAHEVLRTLPRTNKVDWDRIPEIARDYGADPDETRMLCAMGAKLWNEVSASFADAMTEVDLKIEIVPGVYLTGHADLLAISQTSMRVGDWKTGRKDTDHSHQFKAYASMALLSSADITEATGTGLWVRDREIENYTLDRHAADMWVDAVRCEIIEWDGVYRPGRHCGFCPRNFECEAANALVRRDVAAIADVELVSRVECELASMTGDEIATVLHKADLVVKYAERVREAVKAHIERNGDVVGAGVRLTIVEQPSRELDPLKAWPILEQLSFEDEDLARVMKLKISEIEAVIRERAPRGEKASAVLKLGQLLESAGAVTKTTTKRLTEKRA